MPAECLIQHRDETNYLSVKRGMSDSDIALSHHHPQIAQAKGISQIQADVLSNDIDGIMRAFKGC